MAGKNLNISVGVDSKAYKAGWDEVIKVTKGAGATVEKDAEKMVNALNQKFDKMSMRQQIRQMENLAAKMEQTGVAGTKAFSDVIRKTGELKAAQSDLKDLIEASRPDQPFKVLSNTLKSSAQAFAGLQGAMQLFGVESEDAQKALLKVQAALALVEGTKALDGFTDSFKQLNAVIKANPYLIAATAITAITIAIIEYTKELDASEEITKKTIGVHLDQVTSLNQLKSVINSNIASEEQRTAALKRAIAIAPDYLSGLDLKKDKLEEINNAIQMYIELLGLQARAEVTKGMYTEQLKKEIELENQLRVLKKDKKGWAIASGIVGHGAGHSPLEEELRLQKEKTAELKKQSDIIAATAQLEEDRLKKLYRKPTGGGVPTPTGGGGSSTSAPYNPGTQRPVAAVENSMQGIKKGAVEYHAELDKGALPGGALDNYKKKLKEVQIALADEEAWNKGMDLAAKFNNQLETSLESMVENIATAIGSGADPLDAFLNSLADTLSGFGKLLIAQGIGVEAFKESLKSLNGVVAVIAGAGMMAAAAATRSYVSNKAKKFATGGMVDSPTFAMVGDNLNAHNNPEFILRRDQLSKMIQPGGQNVTVTGVIKGQDIWLTNQKYSIQRAR